VIVAGEVVCASSGDGDVDCGRWYRGGVVVLVGSGVAQRRACLISSSCLTCLCRLDASLDGACRVEVGVVLIVLASAMEQEGERRKA
jgi:hypothetical protein